MYQMRQNIWFCPIWNEYRSFVFYVKITDSGGACLRPQNLPAFDESASGSAGGNAVWKDFPDGYLPGIHGLPLYLLPVFWG